VLPLHEVATEPLHAAAKATADLAAVVSPANPAVVESTAKPLHAAVDPGAALTETSYLCVWV
jgi:hypothetical protein